MTKLADQFTLVRGNPGFGRKVKLKGPAGVQSVAQNRTIDVHYFDEATETSRNVTFQDTKPIFDSNKERRLNSDGYTPTRDMRAVAEIPLVWVDWLKRQKGIDVMDRADMPRLLALLDDPQYSFLRCSDGKLSKKPVREYPFAKEGWLKR